MKPTNQPTIQINVAWLFVCVQVPHFNSLAIYQWFPSVKWLSYTGYRHKNQCTLWAWQTLAFSYLYGKTAHAIYNPGLGQFVLTSQTFTEVVVRWVKKNIAYRLKWTWFNKGWLTLLKGPSRSEYWSYYSIGWHQHREVFWDHWHNSTTNSISATKD